MQLIIAVSAGRAEAGLNFTKAVLAMKMKLILLTGLLIPTLRSAVSRDYQYEHQLFVAEWNDFARPMTAYARSMDSGEVIDYQSLKTAMRAWRKLEHDQGWDKIQ